MAIDIPLLNTLNLVVYRLDIPSGWSEDPPGDATKGYNPTLREPRVSRTAGARSVVRKEMTAVKIPVQVEVQTDHQLRMVFGGDAPNSQIAFVARRRRLERMGLTDSTTGNCLIKRGDRVSHLEKRGKVVKAFQATPLTAPQPDSLYIHEVRAKSWGFGSDHYALEIFYTTTRQPSIR